MTTGVPIDPSPSWQSLLVRIVALVPAVQLDNAQGHKWREFQAKANRALPELSPLPSSEADFKTWFFLDWLTTDMITAASESTRDEWHRVWRDYARLRPGATSLTALAAFLGKEEGAGVSPERLTEFVKRLESVIRCVLEKNQCPPSDIEDLCQAAMVALLENGNFVRKHTHATMTWLKTAALHALQNHRRKKREAGMEHPDEVAAVSNAVEVAWRNEILAHLREVDSEAFQILEWRHIDRLTNAAIAEELKISAGHARRKYLHAIAKFRRLERQLFGDVQEKSESSENSEKTDPSQDLL